MEGRDRGFWSWYDQNLVLNTLIPAVLFALQLVHLYWLTADVVLLRLVGRSFFEPNGIWQVLILVVDYFEIPALITTSLVYLNEVRKGEVRKGLTYLVLLNSQWIHILWITDEFVVTEFFHLSSVGFPVLLAWIAIGIDYLELPVIVDTLRRVPRMLRGAPADVTMEREGPALSG